MNNKISAQKVKAFVERWTGKGYEKGEAQKFWLDLLANVFDVEKPLEFIDFEKQVKVDNRTKYLDGYIIPTHVLIEQKGIDIDLRKPTEQTDADGNRLTPFAQAKRYADALPYSKRPRWIVTCNFKSFLIYDMEKTQDEPFEILLEKLPKEAHLLKFLVENESTMQLKHEKEVSLKAGYIVGKLYKAFLEQYEGKATKEELHALNVLCVRLVFCLYAEDAGIFEKDQFADYLQSYNPDNLRVALSELFENALDKPEKERSRFLNDNLKAFPYVNGSLFSQQPGEELPQITKEIADLLINHAARNFDWSDISPTIFGAVFESTLNPETRRKGGMHYTSIENIHKVIDPLFIDELNDEFDDIRVRPKGKPRTQRLYALQDKLANIIILDPACGSGNFLTETYISLRRLENKILYELYGLGQMGFKESSPIKVHIHQFYGIEINDFAVAVSKTALWIAEAQMMNETERIIKFNNDYLPLKSYNNITEGNALRINWEDIVPKDKLCYIIGNPPFEGYSIQSKEQKADIMSLFVDEAGKPYNKAGKIDYVAGWYFKASQLIQRTNIRCAFVSTNSICQGEQVASIWKPLYERFSIHIDFAYRTFRWDSESNLKAHVHCVIVGFSQAENKKKKIFDNGTIKNCSKINPYLIDSDEFFITTRTTPISNVPQLLNGGKPTEGGFLILTEDEEKDILKKEPQSIKFIRPYMMGRDFIDRKPRYCIWLVNASPSSVRACPSIVSRVNKVRDYRLQSPKAATRKKAETPMLFDEVRECESDYIAIPKVSSERRCYIPMDYLSKDIIPGDKLFMMPSASVYHFGILTSNVHMAWMRAVCGRLKSDYSYSNTIVYNNFPWPTPTSEQQARIEKTAQAILDARSLYPDSSLADLYDPVLMPPELLKAHRENDKAVMQAYGFPKDFSESDIVAALFKLYKAMTEA